MPRKVGQGRGGCNKTLGENWTDGQTGSAKKGENLKRERDKEWIWKERRRRDREKTEESEKIKEKVWKGQKLKDWRKKWEKGKRADVPLVDLVVVWYGVVIWSTHGACKLRGNA